MDHSLIPDLKRQQAMYISICQTDHRNGSEHMFMFIYTCMFVHIYIYIILYIYTTSIHFLHCFKMEGCPKIQRLNTAYHVFF